MNSEESIEREVMDYLEGDLEGERLSTFEARLARDPGCLELLCSQALLAAQLSLTPVPRSNLTDTILAQQKKQAMRISLALAAAIALLAALVLHRILVPAPSSFATLETSPGTAYSIQSSGSDQDHQNLLLDRGESLVVSQGTVEVTLTDGTRCLAEAPTQLTLHSETEVFMTKGRAYFDVAKDTKNFTVKTVDLEIIDLGTAFGVDDCLEYQTQVHVTAGEVKATARSGRQESTRVVAGEAIALGAAGTLRPVSSDSSRFIKTLPDKLPFIRFPFDPLPDGSLPVEGLIAQQASIKSIRTNVQTANFNLTEGRFGSGLDYSNAVDFLETTWPGISGTVPRTISFWVKVPTESSAGAIIDWGLFSGGQGMSDLRITYTSGLANLRLVSGRRWLQTTQRLDDDQWHHIAFILESPEPNQWPKVRCYVDGKQEPLNYRVAQDNQAAPLESYDTITDHPDSHPLTFGSRSKLSEESRFNGAIDEMIITAGILTEAQIKMLADPY